ncbi:uncharacterized protein [Coffea arabica]|uniref:DUF674 domain-containing protein n=1 Tax=Coffea arabica TaxID=13443 RepID=A0ABM4WM26_COFAR
MAAAASSVSLKLLIDTKSCKVLFAEANKSTVDFLFHVLSLPVGTVIRLLGKQGMVGCVANLYESIESLNETYIQPNQSKDTLLKPKAAASIPLLSLNDGQTEAVFYRCSRGYNCNYVSDDPKAKCPQCKNVMTNSMTYVAPPAVKEAAAGDEGGFVKGVVTYMVMDDLVVKPMSTISSIALLNRFNVKEVGALEEKEVNLGMNEALMLLKASFESKTVLTNVFLKNTGKMKDSLAATFSESNLAMASAASKVSLKLLIDTKSRKVLFAEANKSTVDFLFHILSLPVGTVIRLLGKQGMVGCVANLYESIESLNETYIQPKQSKDTLLKPRAPASIPLLSLHDGQTEAVFYRCGFGYNCNYVSDDHRAICPQCKNVMTNSMKYVAPPAVKEAAAGDEGGFVKGVVTYMVMDDLVVKPMSTISSIALLNRFNVKEIEALEEKEVILGMNEALKLLKTSLESKCVLTNVFMKSAGK